MVLAGDVPASSISHQVRDTGSEDTNVSLRLADRWDTKC